MACNINKHLIAHKLFLFCMFGAIGSVWPFLTLHAQQIGLSIEEIAVINLIFPFVTASCKPFVGIIVDKSGKYKLILSIMTFAAGTFYTFLLLIPQVSPPSHHQKPPKSLFICSQNGAFLQTPCNKLTDPSNWTIIELTRCSYECDSHVEDIKPSLCLSSDTLTTCIALNPTDKLKFSVLFDDPESLGSDLTPSNADEDAEYVTRVCRIDRSQMEGSLREIKCPSTGRCEVRCDVVEKFIEFVKIDEKRSVSLTFWLYLVLRCLAEAICSSCQPISDAITHTLTGQFGGSFGRQRVGAILSLGFFAAISGLCVDYVSKWTGSVTYVPCFVLYDVLMACSIVSITFIPNLELHTRNQSLTKGLKLLLTNESVVALFTVCFGLGLVWGFMESFLYLFLSEKGASKLLIGMTQFLSVLPAVPILYESKWILGKVGSVNCLIFAFFVYSVRCVGYVFLESPWWSLLLESTKVFTIYLPRISYSVYANKLSVPELRVTTQSLSHLLHSDVGRGVGSLISGTLIEHLGHTTTFQIFAVYTGLFGCTYFSIYHFYLKDRAQNQQKH